MFDTYTLGRHTTEYVPYEKTVVEKRAATDDSIRIYEEVKEKAYKSILDSITVNDNSINTKAIVYKELYSFSTFLQYSVKLNGREYKGRVSFPEEKLGSKVDYLREVYSDLAKSLAKEMLIDLDTRTY